MATHFALLHYRSRSRDRHDIRANGRHQNDDYYSRDRKRRRSESPERPTRNAPPPQHMPDKPEQYACYRGRVTGIMDIGCFVELLGFPQKTEGLVHLSNMSKTRCACKYSIVEVYSGDCCVLHISAPLGIDGCFIMFIFAFGHQAISAMLSAVRGPILHCLSTVNNAVKVVLACPAASAMHRKRPECISWCLFCKCIMLSAHQVQHHAS